MQRLIRDFALDDASYHYFSGPLRSVIRGVFADISALSAMNPFHSPGT